MKKRLALGALVLSSLLYAESMNESLEGFDDTPEKVVSSTENILDGFDEANTSEVVETKERFIAGLTGKFTEQIAYAYQGNTPHDNLNSVKSSLLLDYDYKFANNWRIKTNAKAYYDAIYDIRNENYSKDELKEQYHEIELFDAYVEGSITDNIDLKLGRQVVVWGRSDTIRITDILNPLDNRRPGMVDIEDLRLPVAMTKFDFFFGDWRITPMAILEQRFSKNPAFGAAFNPAKDPHLETKDYNDITYALSIGGEFYGRDINFYAARVYDNAGYIKLGTKPTSVHNKVNMFGTALNILSGSWLIKSELAYFHGLKYTSTQEKKFTRVDTLIGLEYKGISDTMISYDVSMKHLNHYDNRLQKEPLPIDKNTYQHAFRVSADFMNSTLTANYLISLYGKHLNEGGFQRAWIKYELGEGIYTNIGVVDYIGGSKRFDSIKDNDMIFADISYSF